MATKAAISDRVLGQPVDGPQFSVRHLVLILVFVLVSISIAYQSRVAAMVDAADDWEDTFQGFNGVERDGVHLYRWSTQDASIQLADLGKTTPIVVDISAYALRYQDRVYTATVTINGEPVGEITKAGWRHWRFEISDPTVLRADQLIVGLHATPFVMSDLYQDSGDNRRLGVRIESVQVEPQTKELSTIGDAIGLVTVPPVAPLLTATCLALATYAYLCLTQLRERQAWFSVLAGALAFAIGVAFFRPAVALHAIAFVAVVTGAVFIQVLVIGKARGDDPGQSSPSGAALAAPWNRKKAPRWLGILCVFCLGLLARLWEFGALPPGLNQDEASIGYEAYSLLHFGIDRNGFSFPVHFVSWGSGQNALYAYLTMPFVALGLNAFTTRLPMLVIGLGTLPMLYYAVRLSLGREYALISMFLLAVSPWHIMLSRWALESNILPFFFLTGFTFLLRSLDGDKWYLASSVFFALGLYCYGTAYFAVPLYLFVGTALALAARRIRVRIAMKGLAVFAMLATPIALFILINSLGLQTVRLGPLSVPRLATPPLYESLFGFSTANLSRLLQILVYQDDGFGWNTVHGYGYFFKYTFPFALAGLGVLVFRRTPQNGLNRALLILWLGVAFIVGVVQEPNINRINVIFIPLIVCVAACILWMERRFRGALPIAVYIILFGFALFMRGYATDGRARLSNAFFEGLVPAIDFARQVDATSICVTDQVNMPYIFVLFSGRTSPLEFVQSVQYVDPTARFRIVRSMKRFTFGQSNCDRDTRVFVLADQEPLQVGTVGFKAEKFDGYTVYYR